MPIQRPVKRLFDLEIDEVSLVDKPANQFGKVAFSKRAEDEMPQLFDLEGNEVSEDELEHGETVTDESGNEFVFLEEGSPEYEDLAADVDSAYDDESDEYADDYDDVDDDVLAGVGKAIGFKGVGAMRGAQLKYTRASAAGRRVGAPMGRAAGNSVRGARAAGRGARRAATREYPGESRLRGSRGGQALFNASERGFQAGNRNTRKGRNIGRQALGRGQYAASAAGFGAYAHPAATAAGGAAAGGAAYGAHRARRGRASKSFGGEIYEELSKALTQTDRDEAIAKALDVVDQLAAQNEELYDVVGKMADERALEDFSSLAREYGPLPVHPARLGAIMKRAADTMPEEDVEILDRLFSSVGEQLYDEFGKSGTGEGIGVYDQVAALAGDVVSKSDMTTEQAITAIFAENPDAYDEYLAETAR